MQDGLRERDERDWAELFNQAAQVDAVNEAHGAYTCALTMEPFRDPVCTPDGNSFERAALLDHLQRVRAICFQACYESHCIIYMLALLYSVGV
jgi:hypothetical protein